MLPRTELDVAIEDVLGDVDSLASGLCHAVDSLEHEIHRFRGWMVWLSVGKVVFLGVS